MNVRLVTHVAGCMALVAGIACSSPPTDGQGGAASVPDAGEVDGFDWNLPPGFPVPDVPEDNPMTAEKVRLGRHLFYDPRLSGNGTQSCSTCHLQEFGFADGRRLPEGSTGEEVPRNSPGLANVAYASTLTWLSPVLLTLEDQIAIPLFAEFPVELGVTGHEEEVLDRFREDDLYAELFAEAFPDVEDPVDFKHIVFGLASFCRTLISGNAPYDRFVEGDADAMSESAKRGLAMMFEEELDCHHCHNTFNFSNALWTDKTVFRERAYANNGLYNIDATGAYPPGSEGLYEFTLDLADQGKFRTPGLRNVTLTGPYMHDGSVETLDDVLDMYSAGGRNLTEGDFTGDGSLNPNKSAFVHGFTLSAQRRADVMALFEALRDEEFLTDPRFSNPFDE